MTAKPLEIKYGRLTVLHKTDKKDSGNHCLWACRCDCGNTIYTTAHKLRTKNNVSCGCLKAGWLRPYQSSGPEHPTWKGGRYLSTAGYVMVKNPEHPRAEKNGYVAEHILVAEKKLGRPIDRGEEVHHMDGNKTNNAESNLIVFPNKKTHAKHHYVQQGGIRG